MCEPTTMAAIMIGGSLLQGVQGFAAASQNAQYVAEQKATEQALYATQDQRTRKQFRAQIGQQTAELAASDVSLMSPTALVLASEAGRELSFESQSVRSHGAARAAELTATEANLRAQATEALIGGVTSAAGSFLNAAPTVWPGLLS